MPQGAFYAFPNVSAFDRTSDWLADYLLEEAGAGEVEEHRSRNHSALICGQHDEANILRYDVLIYLSKEPKRLRR